MDTFGASQENKPLIMTEGLPVCAAPGIGSLQLAEDEREQTFCSSDMVKSTVINIESACKVFTCLINTSSFSSNCSRALETSVLNL